PSVTPAIPASPTLGTGRLRGIGRPAATRAAWYASRPTRRRPRGAGGPRPRQEQEAAGVEDSGSVAAWLEEAGLVGQHDGLDAVAEVELGQYPPDVDLDCSRGQVHLVGDLAVGEPGGEPGEDGLFPVGELAEQGIGVGLLAGAGEQGGELVDEPPGR